MRATEGLLALPRHRFRAVVAGCLVVWGLAAVLPVSAGAAEGPRVKRVKVKSAAISLGYPDAWLRYDLSKRDIASMGEAAREHNPELVEDLDPQLLAETTKLYAESPLDGDSVQVAVAPGLVGRDKSASEAEFRNVNANIPSFELVNFEKTNIKGKRAFRADSKYETSDGSGGVIPIYEVSLLMQKPGTNDKVVNVVVTVDDNAEDIAASDDIIRSIRPLVA